MYEYTLSYSPSHTIPTLPHVLYSWSIMALTPPAALEALLFASGEALTHKRIAELLGISVEQVPVIADELSRALEQRGLAIVRSEHEIELRTAAEASGVVQKLRESELSRDLGKASLEALAIILYRGSATRSDIDWVRGVNSSAAIRALLLRGLISRSEDVADKRRARYSATLDALAHLGISSREELPRYAEFAAELQVQEEAAKALETET